MVQNEIFKLAVFLLDHVHQWILLLINYSEKASEQFKNRASILASYETYSSQDTASTTAVAGRRSKLKKKKLELELYFYLNTVNLSDKITIMRKITICFNLYKHDLKIK